MQSRLALNCCNPISTSFVLKLQGTFHHIWLHKNNCNIVLKNVYSNELFLSGYSFISLFILCVRGGACHSTNVEVRGHLGESVLSLDHVRPRD